MIPDSRQKTTVIELLPVQNGEEWSVEERASVDVIGDPTSVIRYHADGSEMQLRLPNAARGLSVVVAGGMVKGSRRGPAPLCWAAG